MPKFSTKWLKKSPWVYHIGTGGCNNCVLLVSGPVSYHIKPRLEEVYRQVPKPCVVACIGACACSMGIFKDSYNVAGPVDKVIRAIDPNAVFVYIPGCPPKPETIIMGLVKALQKI